MSWGKLFKQKLIELGENIQRRGGKTFIFRIVAPHLHKVLNRGEEQRPVPGLEQTFYSNIKEQWRGEGGGGGVTRSTGRPTARTNESVGGDFEFYFQVWPRHFENIDIFFFSRRFYFAASTWMLPQILDNTPRRRGPFFRQVKTTAINFHLLGQRHAPTQQAKIKSQSHRRPSFTAVNGIV